ncbi:[NiFe] hydrogenase metallocenter assembly protein HypD [uncultured Gammaproteobacteria bacterium]|jgi:hydrogenase expression/formation protein HypD|nr:[NiFe] hydrogenase metallocenter assembly protein HypD [uncultured Gammaproteobacteria bacterium]CAC9490348.1 [NiFe] hydrogenase metallocenter assembly protein HypD [uncultured Gammaproteobacteria bacterium]CAC9516801.1 [NiFe] hydrogenase metallocenter assembly protein HypD [uncultured Gammaproteobacteria bacterium]CAC9542249.1 [NiFe] hydrogenase metallocenter assembly protein HypD [uncultured Gammaproteobacteria bacterium]CAC9985981.1 [NiFe] hydrogenase metallocenter assembly protein HypD [
MKYVDEFRDPKQAKKILKEIEILCLEIELSEDRPIQIMEVCGGHTHSIFRYGLNQLLPKKLDFVHGPGCPVCVLPRSVVDNCISIANNKDVIFTTFGDAMRVPGSKQSLLDLKAEGADIRMVYSPLDALTIAKNNPEKRVVFFGLGFETTMPSTALSIMQAKKIEVNNFYLFCNHITIIPTIKAVLDSPGMRIDGFLGPGHVSLIIGTKPYDFIADEYHKPLVAAGFEPLDILQSVWMILKQLKNGEEKIENQYKRLVLDDGNASALDSISEVFELRDFFEWRGLGSINHSGVKINNKYRDFDAEVEFKLKEVTVTDPDVCQCGEVLKGILKPWECKVFGKECTPEIPLGALMVSTEGACSAHYSYGQNIDLINKK